MSCRGTKNKPAFRPNFREKPLTKKFYARHESLIDDTKYRPSLNLYVNVFEKQQNFNLRSERLAPLTENEMHGWLSHLGDNYSTGYDPMLLKHHLHTDKNIRTQLRVIEDLLKERRHL